MTQRDDPDVPEWLLGRWRLRRAEAGLEMLPGTLMDFRGGGELVYMIEFDERVAHFDLSYRIQGGILYTEHVHGGHPAAAGFALDSNGFLELNFAGLRAWFGRENLM